MSLGNQLGDAQFSHWDPNEEHIMFVMCTKLLSSKA